MSSPQIHLDVWSDFVCPWCFLAASSVKRLQESHNITVTWHAFELRPTGAPRISETYKQRILSSFEQLEAMAKTHYDVSLTMGDWDVNTHRAHIGFKYAESLGKGDVYHDATFKAYWHNTKRLDDDQVLLEVAESIGIDRQAFSEALSTPEYMQAVDIDLHTAQQLEFSGVPALLFSEKYYISGAQPYPELVRILEQIQAREGASSS